VAVFTLLLSLGAGLLIGLGPSLRTRGGEMSDALRSDTPRGGRTRGGHLVNRLLVAGEVAVATIVVVTSVSVGRRFTELARTDAGFEASDVVTVRVPIPVSRYPRGEPQTTFTRQVLERVQSVPGIERAGFIHILPLTAQNWNFPILPDGFEPRADQPLPSANFRVVAGDYFGALRVPLLSGESFDPRTIGPEGERPMLVNEAFASRFFPGGDALGRTVRLFGNQPYEVVGVVGDVRQFALDRAPEAEMYVPYSTFSPGSIWVMARGSGDLAALGAAVRGAVWQVDPEVPVPTIQTLEQVRADSVARERLVTVLLAAFAALALVLGTVGVYGVTAYAARSRRREWGVRLALGARPDGVIRRALATEMVPVMVGVVVGIAGALAAGRLAASLVTGVAARDPVTLATVPLVLALAGLLAAWLPVWRATRRLDPVAVLRAD
jgi:predicted permease